jgi:hypothetical protein
MTAEVAILNKSAVALAADSKVTVTSADSEKTYDTMNKIFMLSKVHPVGIMVYGNAEFMEYPWETIVKLYRSDRRSKSQLTIGDWGGDFWRFVRRFGPIRERERTNNVRGILASYFASIEEEASELVHSRGVSPNSSEHKKIIRSLMKRTIHRAKDHHGVWANSSQAKLIAAKYAKEIFHQASAFKDQQDIDLALELCILVLCRDIYSPLRSGVVIAGFGNREVFPSMTHYYCDGYIGARIKLFRDDTTIAMDDRSCIQAFAQSDIVHRFMEGIDPNYSDFLQGLFRTTLIETNLQTFEKWAPKSKIGAATRKKMEEWAEAQFQGIYEKAKRYRTLSFAHQIMDMIALLPKDELANLAESLVSLTSLHRRVSRDLETVGGPIDVAVISKSDGFVWIKRKQYFKRELNPQFDHNYMRGIQGVGE